MNKCTCYHAPEQHGPTGCRAIDMMAGECPCDWDGSKPELRPNDCGICPDCGADTCSCTLAVLVSMREKIRMYERALPLIVSDSDTEPPPVSVWDALCSKIERLEKEIDDLRTAFPGER